MTGKQQWRWSSERLTERLSRIRLAASDRLRLLEVAERQGESETTVARRCLLAGLDLIDPKREG